MHNAVQKQAVTQTMKTLITITVMMAAMIEIIDTTIVNVVLHEMAGSLGVSSEEITWVITSYIVSAAILMPLTGFLVGFFGKRRLLLINIIGFLIFSVLCGLSSNLTEMIVFRVMQGVFGASLVPLSMFIIRDTYPPKEQIKAMAIWGIGIMAAPVLGPTLGGYVADSMNWRWIFYINVPICIIAAVMAYLFINESNKVKLKIDWNGLILMSITIGAFQVFLDRGNSSDWFQSTQISILAIIATLGLITFILRGIGKQNNIINLMIFKNNDYSISSILLLLFTAGLFGILTLQPLIMESYMNYSPKLTGLIMAPRGVAAAIAMILVTKLSQKLDIRYIIAIGIGLSSYGSYMYSQISLNTSTWGLVYPELIQGLGLGLFFVPVSSVALRSLNEKDTAEASGVYSFSRSIGTSIGISALVTIMTRQTQVAWFSLSQQVRDTNANYHIWLQQTGLHENITSSIQLKYIIAKQSAMIAFNDASYLSSIIIATGLLVLPFLKKT
jgi:MFS transporter, DHA2 family, multidrug resistance protein